MKILKLVAENVKRLSVVEIAPDGNIVQITGANGQGKTSVLDSIWWALAGQRHVQAAPIRKGAQKARIVLDLGGDKVECVVTRTFTRREDGSIAHTIEVKNDKGFRAPQPQQMLNSFLDALSFDPLWFARASRAEQFEALRRFVPDVDFAALSKADKDDYAARADMNRAAGRARAAAAEIVVPEGLPDEPVDDKALVDQLENAATHNADIEKRRANREAARTSIQNLADEIARIEAQLFAARDRKTALEKRLADAGDLPEPIDTRTLREAINASTQVNAQIARREERARLLAEADKQEQEAALLTARMEEREASRRAAIAAAKMPIEGLSFGDDVVLFEGFPFDQASDAIQLRVSCGLGMASNSQLRVMRIRDGSLLDSASLTAIAEAAKANDYQVWIERVDESGAVGFVLEDGHLRGKAPPIPEDNADG